MEHGQTWRYACHGDDAFDSFVTEDGYVKQEVDFQH